MEQDTYRTSIRGRLDERPEWASAVTARDLPTLPVHRWFYFPHSFSPSLVADLLDDWSLSDGATIADPYVGAGTSLVAASQLGYAVCGWDLSPLAVLASRVKTTPPSHTTLRDAWRAVTSAWQGTHAHARDLDRHTSLIRRAFPDDTLGELTRLVEVFDRADIPEAASNALQLAVLAELPAFSRLVRKGGWLASVSPAKSAPDVYTEIDARVQIMLADLEEHAVPEPRAAAQIDEGDSRCLPCTDAAVQAIITSPPYPNRHDYTRVFGVELAFAFLDTDGIRQLRYQSMSSHPEAHPHRPDTSDYEEPPELTAALETIQGRITDPRAKTRIPPMLAGYFVDLWLSLREVHRILTPGGHAAFVVGNAQYTGITIEVDTILAKFAASIGLTVDRLCVARRRGNSAQQMKTYGRQPQRETVVILSL